MTTTPSGANAPEALSITEAAERMKVHRATIHRWIERGLLTRHRTPTGQVFVRADELDALRVPVPDDGPE